MASRHSAFYTPLLTTVVFLREEGHEADYGVLAKGQRTYELLRDGEADVIQSAVSSNWPLMEEGIEPLPVHFAQINRRDGFFIAARRPQAEFQWKELEGKTLLADHGGQPLAMLKFAVKYNGVDWGRIHAVDAGTPEEMAAAFRGGAGDYLHAQGPVGAGEIAASVGASMPPVAFSSLCCARDYQQTGEYRGFVDAFERAKEWSRTARPEEIAAKEAGFFPGISPAVLADAIGRYQRLGTWEGGIEIPRDLYEQAVTVFQSAGAARP